MAGYSGTPLPGKLGIKPGARVFAVDAPKTYQTDTWSGLKLVIRKENRR